MTLKTWEASELLYEYLDMMGTRHHNEQSPKLDVFLDMMGTRHHSEQSPKLDVFLDMMGTRHHSEQSPKLDVFFRHDRYFTCSGAWSQVYETLVYGASLSVEPTFNVQWIILL